MQKLLFYFAVTGWGSGLIVHLLSLAGFDVSDKVPYVWVLHIGIFVAWFPAILSMKRNGELKAYKQSGLQNRLNPLGHMHNHGQLIKTLTKQEYHHYKANELRGFSGHWLAFYGLAAAILFPFNGRQMNNEAGTEEAAHLNNLNR